MHRDCDKTAAVTVMTGQADVEASHARGGGAPDPRNDGKEGPLVKQGNTRIEAVCGKCGAPNRVQAEKGATRVKYVCKQCGDKQVTL